MRHAREDYNRFQDPAGIIPEDEPVFLIRGQDKAGPDAVRSWAFHAKTLGASGEITERAMRWADEMERYQQMTGRSQVPDLPESGASAHDTPPADKAGRAEELLRKVRERREEEIRAELPKKIAAGLREAAILQGYDPALPYCHLEGAEAIYKIADRVEAGEWG